MSRISLPNFAAWFCHRVQGGGSAFNMLNSPEKWVLTDAGVFVSGRRRTALAKDSS